MWHNLRTCQVIYDRNGRLEELKQCFNVPYPRQLKENIIKRNRKLLFGTIPAYQTQIEKAVKRRDMISINHRTTAFIESYFDIIFAINELTHPGEKRLVQLCKEQCKILPNHFEKNIHILFYDLYRNFDRVMKDINVIITELQKVLELEIRSPNMENER